MNEVLERGQGASATVDPWVGVLGGVPVPGNPFEQRVWQGASRLELRSAGPGRLPDVAELDDLVVIFDGVLHNAAAMAAMLDAPEGTSPAGLVARAHVKWGDGAFHRIKASFACALWQASTNTLKLVRDAVGTYPMFFSEASSRVAFGVDAEPLLSLPWVSRTLNRAVIADHLSHRWLNHHETHYQELSRVPAGFIVTWQGGVRRFERYWYPVDPSGRIEWVHDEALHEFQGVFEEAIARCLRQGPAAIFLSGGFDSVSIGVTAADLSRRHSTAPPIAASLFFPDPSCNEEPVQRSVAAQLGLDHVALNLDDAMGDMGLIRAGVEMNRTSPMPMMNAWRPAYRALGDHALAAGARVTMTGEGGDEWLTVGPEYMIDLLRSLDVAGLRLMLGTVLRSYDTSRSLLLYNMLWRFAARPLLASYGRETLRRVAPGRLARHRLGQLEARSPDWVSPDPELQRELRTRMERWTAESLEEPEPRGPYAFYLSTLPGGFLHPLRSLDVEETFQSRRRTGLRELQPYWDPDLIQFLCRVHPTTLDRGGRTKGLVRDEMARRFPGLGFERHRKVSASTFFSERMAAEGPVAWDELRGVRSLAAMGIVNWERAEAAARADTSKIARSGNIRVWEMLNLEAWVRGKS